MKRNYYDNLLKTQVIFLTLFFIGLFNLTFATVYVVTDNGDNTSYPGTTGQLRWALWQCANGDEVVFNLPSGQETITCYSAISVSDEITLDGDNTAGSGVNITLKVPSPGASTFPALSISAYLNVIVKNMTFIGGDAVSSSGGTIYNDFGYSLTLENCIIKQGDGRFGGGLYFNGTGTTPALTITNCTFQDNTASDHGCGIRAVGATVTITDCIFDNNDNNNTSTGNHYGGACYFYNCDITIDNTTFKNNLGGNQGGAISTDSYSYSTLTITNSTFYNNSTKQTGSGSGGAIYCSGTSEITNCTFKENSTTYSGGALNLGSGTHYLTNVTVVDNILTSTLYNSEGISSYGTLYIKNCLLANNDMGDFDKSGGTVVDNGYNIVETGDISEFTSPTNITGEQANLFGIGVSLTPPLADNGTLNATQTIELPDCSLAINRGGTGTNGTVAVPTLDQRGITRDDDPDIGAYEYTGTPPPLTEPTVQASAIILSNVDHNSFVATWTAGDGDYTALFVKQGASGTAAPVDGDAYSASSVFGSGDQIGTTGWYCVYSSTETSVEVTGLNPETTYILHAITFNANCLGTTDYLVSTATNNPVTQTTDEQPPTPPVETFESGDFTVFPWVMGGNADWTIDASEKYEGNYSAKSGTITHNQVSSMQVTMDITANGNISFYRKVSSEGCCDKLRFYIDGVIQGTWIDQTWIQSTFAVLAGTHTFKWEYYKDGSVSSGSDCAWVDNIAWPPFGPTEIAWTGSTSSDWNTAGNWDLNSIPTASDNVTIPVTGNNPMIGVDGGVCNDLTIESGAALSVSGGSLLTHGSVTNQGAFTIDVSLSTELWELIGTPVEEVTANLFLGDYLQSYTEATDTWNEIMEPTDPLVPGVGYALWMTVKDVAFTYTGTPNTGNFSTAYTYTPGGNPLHYGFNLMGNPYPSAIDWGTLNSTYGAVYHYDGTNYYSWNGTGAGSRYVSPGEGFLIAPGASGTLNLTNDCRTLTMPAKATSNETGAITISANSDNFSDMLYIVFNDEASGNFDLQFDAWKILADEYNVPQLFTINNGQHYSIDQRPACDELPLGFSCKSSGAFTIAQQQNSFGGVLFLEDLVTGTIHNLSQSDYTFDWSIGEDNHRFNLHFSPLGVDHNLQNNVSVYTAANTLFINTEGSGPVSIKVHDMIGHLVLSQKLNQSNIQIPLKVNPGVYMVTVISGKTAVTKKVYIQ